MDEDVLLIGEHCGVEQTRDVGWSYDRDGDGDVER